MDLITSLGGPTELARLLGCKPPSVTEWRVRGIPAERCPAIERAKEGRFTCEQMRPDIKWVRVPDPEWPWHPQGRPLRDDTGLSTEPAIEAEKAVAHG